MVAHKDLTGVDLHEPKGIDEATLGQVYVADGSGSGVWQDLNIPEGTFRVSTTVFTSSGTWTKPDGLFLAKIHVVGSGGTSARLSSGINGTSGGATSFGSHCSASGGAGGTATVPPTYPAGGVGSNGNFNGTGGSGVLYTGISLGGFLYSIGTAPVSGAPFGNRGSGGIVALGDAANHLSGAAGGYAWKWVSADSLGATETVTLNTAGMNNGICVVEEYIFL